MDLKEKSVASFLAFENKVSIDTDSNVHDIRSEAFDHFEEHGFPTKKDEDWKYTSLNSILKHNYNVLPETEVAVAFAEVKRYFLHEIDSYKIVFIDGVYSSFLSETSHDGYDIACSLRHSKNQNIKWWSITFLIK